MATKRSTLRLLLTMAPDTDEEPTCELDTSALPIPLSVLEGYKVVRVESLTLAPAAVDQAVVFTDAIAIILESDSRFDMRLAAAETLLENLRLFAVWPDDTDDGIHQVSVLLTGNETAEAQITAYIIEKP